MTPPGATSLIFSPMVVARVMNAAEELEMNTRRAVLLSMVIALAITTWVYAQDPVPGLQDLIGARGTAVDGLGDRGYTYVKTEKSDQSSYTYWREEATDRCVTVRVEQGKVASAVYAPSTDCAAEGGSQAAAPSTAEKFPTVCGVIVDGKTHRYRCEVEDTTSAEGKKMTILRFPDIEMTLHWHRQNNVGVSMEGTKTVQTTYSTREGETDFEMDGKTYFYISDKRAAKKELENFKD